MNEMIERATDAAHAARLNYDGVYGLDKTIALAVMRAMREPTEAMVRAGIPGRMDDGGTEGRWRAMVDIACRVD